MLLDQCATIYHRCFFRHGEKKKAMINCSTLVLNCYSSDEVMNIWKSYMWTTEWRIIWTKIIAVIYATFTVAKRRPEKKIDNFVIIILSRVYNEPIQRPSPSWLVSLIGRALHRYRRGQGFESNPVQVWSLFRLSFGNCKSCVYNCDDLPSYNATVVLLLKQCSLM